MRRRSPISNSLKPNKRTIPNPYNNTLDRIQLSVSKRNDSYRYLKQIFTDKFGKPTHVNSKGEGKTIVSMFKYREKYIQILYYTSPDAYRFAVIIQDPDYDILSLIRDMLISLFGCECDDIVKIQQIEFTWDFTPENGVNVWDFRNAIVNSIYLKGSRVGSCVTYNLTVWQGKDGNVRSGSKGLRLYVKKINNEPVFRIELQFNRPIIRDRLKLKFSNLPIPPSLINLYDYVEFRRGYDDQGLSDLVWELIEKTTGKKSRKHKPICKKSMGDRIRHRVFMRYYFGEEERNELDDNITVAQQISGYKRIKEDYGIMYPIGHYFPNEVVLSMRRRGPKLGFLRVPQWTRQTLPAYFKS